MPLESSIDVNGASLAYLVAGEGDKGLVITLHGGRGFGSKESDFSVYSKLANFGFKVVSFDFRGHGNSSFTGPFTFRQIVDDVEGIRQHFAKDEKCIIIGGSFGGFIAQQYALTYSEHTRYLVLRGTASSYHHEEDAIEVLKSRLHKATNASIDMLKKVFSSFESDEEMRLVMFALAPLYSESYNPDKGLKSVLTTKYYAESHNQLYSETEKYFDYTQQLPSLAVPTLIICGSKDWICPPKQSQKLHNLIPSSKLVLVENANHSVHLEKPDTVLEEIVAFVSK